MDTPADILLRSDLIRYGFCSNVWVWFHILGGGVLARVIIFKLKALKTLGAVGAIAFIWEIIEVLFDNPVAIYGSWSRWAYDSAGDIIGTLLAALLIVSMTWGKE